MDIVKTLAWESLRQLPLFDLFLLLNIDAERMGKYREGVY